MFRKDPNHAAALRVLTLGQRTAFAVLAAGAVLPVFFMATVRPVFWLAAVQLACVAGTSYIRWRSPIFRGSVIVLCAAVVACLVLVAAAVAA